ncbi:hypothetical protein FS837_010140 [Tulasnella sp. UAMH 9824]|nr:hypothetical protein FS837_010140 [Tulasnella sp. UAMH 9824]
MTSLSRPARRALQRLSSKQRNISSIALAKERIPLDVSPEVEDALETGKPVVALESTIITHGMPYPTNIETTYSLENIIRKKGAVPATIGLLNGRVKIGLDKENLERLGAPRTENKVYKVSRRDIAPVIALGKDGGTTISGTMILAALAGIRVFATGGLGGVHRGGEITWDVSADLTELGRTPVAVVAAGAKSILDIGRTLEYLETQGVTVATYGEHDDFPAFFTPSSGFKSPWRVSNPTDAAKIIHMSDQLGLGGGQFFGVPIPESHYAAGAAIQAAVDRAVRESEENGMSVRGKEVTPWLLNRVAELTRGESLKSNVALIENTALVGAQIAVELAKMSQPKSQPSTQIHPVIPSASTYKATPVAPVKETSTLPAPKLVVIGASAIDITAKASQRAVESTSPGVVDVTLGGVARNMAEAAHRCSETASTLLISPTGNDAFATLLKQQSEAEMGMRVDGFFVPQTTETLRRTPVCNLVLGEDGGLISGVADFNVVDQVTGEDLISRLNMMADSTELIAVDANFPPATIKTVVEHCVRRGHPVWFEPTSTSKCTRIFPALESVMNSDSFVSPTSPIAYASPNTIELAKMYEYAKENELVSSQKAWERLSSFGLAANYRTALEQLTARTVSIVNGRTVPLDFISREGIAQMAVQLLPYFQHLVVKCGDRGVLVAMVVPSSSDHVTAWKTDLSRFQITNTTERGETLVLKYFPPLKIDKKEVVSTTGAGDSLVGSLMAAVVKDGEAFRSPSRLDDLMRSAQGAAVMSLKSSTAVSALLSSAA